MTRKVPAFAIIISLSLLIAFGAGLYAGGSAIGSSVPEPGSAGDPLVTQSYLHAYVEQHGGSGGGGSSYEVVNVAPGGMLEGGEGTEIILRAGNATAVANSAGSGLSNVTVGKDLGNGEKLPLNHLLIIPRADGRGAKVPATGGTAIFLVRGAHTIK
ncbi:MAG: hypothetical protein KGZ63_02530 [Clostridiales bacterium]|nr:hypothetical protein [Clostridiales bacterium]